ncbi:FG-GAP-like repeat-containing protein [Phyllobacterium leguminum]|uniref:YVTN family beta-propeller protein n=1 Tax=Phyllobacterium leguminum TaxID=314237 RepID=A0A318T6G1_9HYPH|nr:FG-GAP-like repeat-containing protein [Phyllobacterium leguminum]PYE90042.1 YVTN family beta-propeller protein [Phyllobacterium leguminum]
MIFKDFSKVYWGWLVAAWAMAAGLMAGALLPAYATPANTQIGIVEGYDGQIPFAFALTPDGKVGYVLQPMRWPNGDSAIAVIDIGRNMQVGYVKNYIGAGPTAIAMSPDGKIVYVSNGGPGSTKSISVIDVATNTQTDTINLPDFQLRIPSMALSPDGKTAYVSFATGSSGDPDPGIAVIDIATKGVSFIPPSPKGYMGMRVVAVSPNGDKAYATIPNAPAVAVIDTRTNTQTGMIKNWDGSTPFGIGFSPDGKKAYITSNDYGGNISREVLVVDVATDTVTGAVKKGLVYPPLADITFSPDGKNAYFLDGSGYLENTKNGYVITTATNTITDMLHGYVTSDNFYPIGNANTEILAVTPDNGRLYIATPCGANAVVLACTKVDNNKSYIAIITLLPLASTINKDGVLPSSGSIDGKTQVTVHGTNLLGTSNVTFGGVAGTDLQIISDTELTVTTPSHQVGTVDVVVENGGGNAIARAAYTYITDREEHCGAPMPGARILSSSTNHSDSRYLTAMAAGDYNQDGRGDLAIASFRPERAVNVFLARTDGTFSWWHPFYSQSTDSNTQPTDIYDIVGTVTGDFNNDGILDLVTGSYKAANNANGEIIYLQGKGNGDFDPPVMSSTRGGGVSAVADFNRDGNLDVVFVTYSTSSPSAEGVFQVHLGDGYGLFRPYGSPQDLPNARQFIFSYAAGPGMATGDFNNDGKPDLLIAEGDTGASVYLGDGNGAFESNPAIFNLGAGNNARSVVATDFDGDRVLDFAVGSDAVLALYRGAGDGKNFERKPNPLENTSSSGISLAVGDFNNDGWADIVASLLGKRETKILINSGCRWAFMAAKVQIKGQYDGYWPVVGDFNGDGFSDVAVLDDMHGLTSALIVPEVVSGSQTVPGQQGKQ